MTVVDSYVVDVPHSVRLALRSVEKVEHNGGEER